VRFLPQISRCITASVRHAAATMDQMIVTQLMTRFSPGWSPDSEEFVFRQFVLSDVDRHTCEGLSSPERSLPLPQMMLNLAHPLGGHKAGPYAGSWSGVVGAGFIPARNVSGIHRSDNIAPGPSQQGGSELN
jgi:hypothetical protein